MSGLRFTSVTLLLILHAAVAFARDDRAAPPIATIDVAVVWRTASIPAADRGAILRQVSAIWERYGVRCRWRAAATKARGRDGILMDVSPAASGASGAAEVTLIVEDPGPRPAVSPMVADLGWVRFRDGVPDPVLHVSVDGVRRVAAGARFTGHALESLPPPISAMLIGRILARAAAHELGHYLLGSAAHSTRGLMRARYSAWEAGSLEPGLVELDAPQRRLLRQRVVAAEARQGAAPSQERFCVEPLAALR